MPRQYSPMEPGRRDRIVTIQSATEGVDSAGAPIQTLATLVADMPCLKEDLKGDERFGAGQEVSKFDSRFEINYRADMDPDLIDVPKSRRLLFHGRPFDIVHAEQIGRREGVSLYTLAGTRTT